jgi:hypothetical protein
MAGARQKQNDAFTSCQNATQKASQDGDAGAARSAKQSFNRKSREAHRSELKASSDLVKTRM